MRATRGRRMRQIGLAALALCGLSFQCPIPLLPVLVSSDPLPGGAVPSSHWLALEFQDPVDEGSLLYILGACDGVLLTWRASRVSPTRVVVNPSGLLPTSASCALYLETAAGRVVLPFQTLGSAGPFVATYDRRDVNDPLPFPDDFFLDVDATTPTGYRPNVAVPDHSAGVAGLLGVMAGTAALGDGWSPIGSLAVHVDGAPSNATLPLDPEASLDPLATVQLIDMTPSSPTLGQRVPFKMTHRADALNGPTSHDLVLFPGVPLELGGTYGLVVTNRVLDGTGAPLGRSPFFEAILAPAVGGEDAEIAKTRPLAEAVLAAAEALAPVPIPRDDVALAVRITVRSLDGLEDDLLDMRASVLGVPPNVQITSVASGFGDVAAIVEGTFDVPSWGVPFVNRDVLGSPDPVGVETLDFILALPDVAETDGEAPIAMYQHGSPGSAQNEVPSAAANFLAGAGFAVAGFTDVPNARYPTSLEQSLAIFGVVLAAGEVPDFYVTTYAQQIAFVKALQSMANLDLLPLAAPDGVPDLDPSSIVYEGISYGSVHGQAFLAYEPAILAAGLVTGSARLAELLEYQDRTTPTGDPRLLMETIPSVIAGVRPVDVWMGIALFATVYDRQDPHNHARFLYREPLLIDGTTKRASVLVQAGIGDSFTKNNSSRSLAWLLGIEHLTPTNVDVSYLPQAAPPVQGNVDSQTTGAYQQFVPVGTPGLPPSPGCASQPEGHYCGQVAGRSQRAAFYQSAVEQAVPVIDAP